MDSDTLEHQTDIAKYEIKIKELNNETICNYIKRHKPLNSSAAFRYEVAKDLLVEKFFDKENDISGLIGLPLKKLKVILKSYQI